jgi:hypothetical protein
VVLWGEYTKRLSPRYTHKKAPGSIYVAPGAVACREIALRQHRLGSVFKFLVFSYELAQQVSSGDHRFLYKRGQLIQLVFLVVAREQEGRIKSFRICTTGLVLSLIQCRKKVLDGVGGFYLSFAV